MILLESITPELSRDAQRPSGVLHDSATSEAAKRSRLERIVMRQPISSCEFWKSPDSSGLRIRNINSDSFVLLSADLRDDPRVCFEFKNVGNDEAARNSNHNRYNSWKSRFL